LSVKKGYNRYFIIFQEEDKGYGMAIDKQPTGYAKIEVKNGKCKITVYAQNIKKEKGPFNFCMIDTNRSPANLVKLGEVRIDDIGTGETYWEYNEDNICDSGHSIENYNVAVLLADSNRVVGVGAGADSGANVNINTGTGIDGYEISAPLSGYIGKERVLWKEKINIGKIDEVGENSRNAIDGINKKTSRNENLESSDDMIKELDEEGMKFKEYEAAIRNEADRMSNTGFEQEKRLQTDSEDFESKNAQIEDEMNIYEFGMEEGLQRHNKHGHKNQKQHGCKYEHDSYDNNSDSYGQKQSSHYCKNNEYLHDNENISDDESYEHNQSSNDHNDDSYEHNQSSNDHNDYGYEHNQSSDDHNGYGYDYNQSSNDHNHDSNNKDHWMNHKHKSNQSYADIFHYLLNEFEESSENFMDHEIDKVRWWKIPYRYDAKLINEKHYPFMCTIFHLSMAYPHVDYIKYFYETGHYYFGIKYDENNEVKYLMYGIVGRNNVKDQPYMGMTGFNKWIGKPNKEMGVWIMFYNPKTGNIMVEKNK
jgi:hypothetical protein